MRSGKENLQFAHEIITLQDTFKKEVKTLEEHRGLNLETIESYRKIADLAKQLSVKYSELYERMK